MRMTTDPVSSFEQLTHLDGGRYLLALASSAEYAVIGTTLDGTIAYFNPGAEHLLGYRAEEVLYRHTIALFPDSREMAARSVELGIEPGPEVLTAGARRGRPETREWTCRRKEGSAVEISLTVSPVHDEAGALVGFSGIAHDVDRCRRAGPGATIRRELERLREDFYAGASHDLRTPLAAIKASIGVVLANEPPGTPAPLHRMFVNIDAAADRMMRQVADLLELARLQSGRARPEFAPCDLTTIVRRSARAIEPLAQSRDQRLHIDLPAEPIAARVDAERLERAVLNLLTNAQAHGRSGGTIRLGLSEESEEAIISVADDGPGIPETEQSRIFDRFHGFVDEMSWASPASGLGLPLARVIAELHGGRLGGRSTPGTGSTFWIALPINSKSDPQWSDS